MTRDFMERLGNRAPEVCSVCGDPDWQGCWVGHVEIRVCYRCATQVLPCLIADATWEHSRHSHSTWVLEQVELHYWRALALQALKRLESAQ